YRLKPSDVVTVRERSRRVGRIIENASYAESREFPDWLHPDPGNLTIEVLALPERNQIDVPVQEQLIVEYYSK
ncbi:MAG TPA: 30S ribosomal protein S4, partial [Actinomycetota bacterium]|nr:30S ribosomal protein S4 [Actinomycetota bacterium]